MNALERLLWSFEESDLDEIVLAANRAAEGVTNDIIAPLGDDVWTTDALVNALVAFGGSRHVEDLGPMPRQWTARVNGLGVITISATQNGADVEARFRLTKRNAKSSPPPPMDARARGPTGHATPEAPIKLPETTRLPPQRAIPAAPPPPPPPPPPPAIARMDGAPAPPGRGAPVMRRFDTPTNVNRPIFNDVALDAPPDAPSLDLAPPIVPHRPAAGGRAPQAAPPPAPPFARAAGLSTPSPPATSPLSMPPLVPPVPPSSKRSVPPPPGAPGPAALDLPPPPPPPTKLSTLLANARDARASDLHIIAGRPPLYRVAGELRGTGPVVSAEHVERMVLPLVPDRLVAVLEEQGSCDFAVDDATHGRFRVNVSRQQTGYKACLRLITRELPTVDSLRLPDGIAAAAHHHQGLIVFTGPTGHGKTTTMSAIVDLINRTTSHHVITVEDPVEHLHAKKSALMSQREVGTHTASFASALKASLREDPDVIVVGELRDVETVRMAVSASETGHLVLGTMNTPSAARTLDRLIDLFPPADQPQVRMTLAAGLRLIVSQRLVPSKDGTGMHAAFEVLPGSVPLAALIRDNKTFQIPSLQQRGKALGIVRLDESLVKLVAEDRVSLEAAKAIAEAPLELDASIKAYRAGAR